MDSYSMAIRLPNLLRASWARVRYGRLHPRLHRLP